MAYGEDVYSNPGAHGLTLLCAINDDEPWQFDMICLWEDEDGRQYWARDAGCSCPSPFEDYTDLDSLNPVVDTYDMLYQAVVSHPSKRKAQLIRMASRRNWEIIPIGAKEGSNGDEF